jgi:competence protein ComEC
VERTGGWIAPVLAGIVLGTALQLQQAALWALADHVAALVAVSVGAAVWSVYSRRLPQRWRAMAWCLAAAAFVFTLTGARAAWFASSALDPALEGRDLAVVGIVASLPQRTEAGTRFRLRVESARSQGREVPIPPQLLLGWYGGVATASEGRAELQRQPAALRPGERWQLAVRLKAPHGHVNPHGFDYELWLWEQGLQATGYVRAGPRDAEPRRIGTTWQHPVEQARDRVREAIFQRVQDPRWAGVLAALVVGDQGAIERADWDVFRATGVAHLMSISGLHVTMFAWAAAALIGALWRRSSRLCLALPAQQAGLAGGLLLATAYAVFSGWGVPAQRTVWMLAAVALLRLAGKQWPWPWVWLFACAVVVLVDPWCLLQPGFWLSFVAVGVLFAADRGRPEGARADGTSPTRARRVLAAAGALWREQWVVTVALTPLSLLLFSQVSLVGIVANLLAIPWVTLVVTPLGLGGVLLAPLWDVAAAALALLGAGLALLAQWPFATWSVPTPPLWAGAAGVLGGLLLALRLPWSLRAIGIPLLLPALLWLPTRPPEGAFELLAADVGQGNAVLVRTARHALLYDAGPAYSRESDAGQRVVVPLLRALGETLDTVVLSHRDNDHTGGAVAVLGMQAQARLVSSLEPAHPLVHLRGSRRCEAGQHWAWDGVRFEVLHPQAADYDAPHKSNGLSCVLRIVGTGGATALLAGDIERPQELALARSGVLLKADLLLVPHHGSTTSSTAPWLAAVRPAAAIVQAGYRNRFGHPAAEVVQRYQSLGVQLADSARCGAARWRSWEPEAVHCERDAAPRYWRHRMP